MIISTKTRYGARAISELAKAYPDGALSAKEVARKQRLSVKYLEQILSTLKTAGLIRAIRGAHGGYKLTRPPAEIKMIEVFRVLEGSAAPVDCVDHPDSCEMKGICPTRDTWVQIKEAVEGVLESTTLEDLARRSKGKADSAALVYHI